MHFECDMLHFDLFSRFVELLSPLLKKIQAAKQKDKRTQNKKKLSKEKRERQHR